jgi:hypothetical protein
MAEFKKQLTGGYLQEAYQGLMEYFRQLRAHFKKAYPAYSVPSNIYYGYLDMTYFAIIPESLKRRKLKIAIVLVYDEFRFEVWLSGANRNVQAEYWKLIKESSWDKYQLASNPRTEDYVIGHILSSDPDFRDLTALTAQIEAGTLSFIREVEVFLSS